MKLLRVLYVASELAPFTGDSALAKENHFLSRALAELGADVTVVLPGHRVAAPARVGLARRLSPLTLPAGPGVGEEAGTQDVILYEGSASPGRAGIVVMDLVGEAASEDASRFCRAALELVRARTAWPDVVIAGPGAEDALRLARSLGGDDLPAPATLYLLRGLDDTPAVRDALGHADRVVVPSARWAQELRQHVAAHPAGRDRISRLLGPVSGALHGVAGGIDTVAWNPSQDGHLTADLVRNPLAGKAHHKDELARELGLRPGRDRMPLVAVLGPLEPDIITYGVANALSQSNALLVFLADAERDATSLRHVERLLHQAPSRVAVRAPDRSDAGRALEHRLMAAADFTLFAHRFSPAALCELHGMRYGAVPIAPQSGSFADVLVEFDALSGTGSGFLFEPGDDEALMAAVHRGLRVYHKPEPLAALVERAMHVDLSWRTPAQRYVNILLDLLRDLDRLAA